MIRLILERPELPPSLMAFARDEVVIGRGAPGEAPPDWVLPHADVSRRQCRIFRAGEAVLVEPLGAKGNTFLNQRKISAISQIEPGDVVRFGNCTLRLAPEVDEVAGSPKAEGGAARKLRAVETGAEAASGEGAEGADEDLSRRAGRRAEAGGVAGSPGGHVGKSTSEVAGGRARSVDEVGAGEQGRARRVEASAVSSPEGHVGKDTPEVAGGKARGSADDEQARVGEGDEDMSPIVEAAQAWELRGRPSTLLLRGPALQRGRAWLRGESGLGDAGALVRRYVETSLRARRSGWRRACLGLAAIALAIVGGTATADVLAGELALADPPAAEDGARPVCKAAMREQADELARLAGEAGGASGLLLAGHALRVADEGACRHLSSAEATLRQLLAGRRSRTIGALQGGVRTAALRADGRLLAAVDAQGRVHVWDASLGGPAVALADISGPARVLAWSGDLRWLATGGDDGEVALWDAKPYPQVERRLSLPGHRGAISGLAFSRDGAVMASGDERGALRLWDMGGDASGDLLGEVDGLPGALEALTFDASGERLFARAGGEVKVFRVSSSGARRLAPAPSPESDTPITSMAVSLDGRRVATGDATGLVHLWEAGKQGWRPRLVATRPDAVLQVALVPGREGLVVAAADRSLTLVHLAAPLRRGSPPLSNVFDAPVEPTQHLWIDPSGRRAVTVGAGGATEIWDLVGRQAAPLVRLSEQRAPVMALAGGQQSSLLVLGDEDGALRGWDVLVDGGSAGAHVLTDHRAAIDAVALSPGGTTLASAGRDQRVRVWGLDGDGTPAPQVVFQPAAPVQVVAVDPDGRWVAGAAGTTIHVWDVESRTGRGREPVAVLAGHAGEVRQLAFSGGGDWLVSADQAGEVRTWRVSSSGPEAHAPLRVELHQGVWALALAGDYLAVGTGGGDAPGRVHLWPLGEGRADEPPLWTHTRPVTALAFDAAGQRVASGSADGVVSTGALQDGRFQETEGYVLGQDVSALAFAPEREGGATLAIGGAGGRVVLHRPGDRGAPVRRLPTQEAAVTGLAFRGSDEELLVAGQDGVLTLWSLAAEGERALPLTGHSGPITALRADAAGRVVVTAGDDRTLRVWPLEVEALQQLVCRAVGRDLRDDEWVASGPVPAPLCAGR